MATQGVQTKFWGVQNAFFGEIPHENERIRVISGCANTFVAQLPVQNTGAWVAG